MFCRDSKKKYYKSLDFLGKKYIIWVLSVWRICKPTVSFWFWLYKELELVWTVSRLSLFSQFFTFFFKNPSHTSTSSFGFLCISGSQGMRVPSYNGELLHLSEDLARRLLPAFDTPTGISTGIFCVWAALRNKKYEQMDCITY